MRVDFVSSLGVERQREFHEVVAAIARWVCKRVLLCRCPCHVIRNDCDFSVHGSHLMRTCVMIWFDLKTIVLSDIITYIRLPTTFVYGTHPICSFSLEVFKIPSLAKFMVLRNIYFFGLCLIRDEVLQDSSYVRFL